MAAGSARQRQIARLNDEGYVIIPGFVDDVELRQLCSIARAQLAARAEPLEFEADLHYPGAPPSRTAVGGETIRRLLDAHARSAQFAAMATTPRVREWMEAYFAEDVLMSRAHHNCLMTKHPRYGSLTGWHRDIRFWSFEREELVSVWIALGHESVENGGLWFVPGSHGMTFSGDRFDEAKFFRGDRDDNAELIRSAESPALEPGDAVFFHCNTLHSAGPNRTDQVKFSLVNTYHGRSNAPKPGTRSASKPDLPLRATPD
jgi:phytanoyl-CoA hydroxylase